LAHAGRTASEVLFTGKIEKMKQLNGYNNAMSVWDALRLADAEKYKREMQAAE